MKKLVLLLAILLAETIALAGDKNFTWDYADPVGNNVTEFKIRWGTVSGGPYTNSKLIPANQSLTTAIPGTLTGLKPGTYFVVVSAMSGTLESQLSNEVSAQVFPDKPTNFTTVP